MLTARSVISNFIKLAGYDRDKLIPGYKGKFVIHDHEAERAGHHFDLRLEFPVTSLHEALKTYEGKRVPGTPEPLKQFPDKPGTVFRSFAVRKHKLPTEDTKLFIAETEDHPVQYGTFKGTIPSGYGAGEVGIFDHGTFELLDVEGDKKYVVSFSGDKLNGVYSFVKYQKGYLWVKNKDQSKKASIDWASMPENFVDFAAKLGLGPKYVPTPRATQECPTCHQANAYYREYGADCDAGQNEVLLYCPDCSKKASQKPPIFEQTIYRLPTKNELIEVDSCNLSADDILGGFEYTIVGRGIMRRQQKEMIISAIESLCDLFPNSTTYKKALKKAKEIELFH